jgi:signal transduction histidine kinase
MLELARADMTRPGSLPAIPVAPIIGRVAEHYRAQGMSLSVVGPPVSTTLAQDGLEAVIVSLLDNAQTHAGRAANVRITTSARNAQTRIDIEDDGPGISAANQPRVFDPFFTTARDAGGTGLGLPIARAILVGAGGGLDIVPAETGAHFVVLLPNTEDFYGKT